MKIKQLDTPTPAISIDNFIPSEALVRAAAASFETFDSDQWVKYAKGSGQVQYCSRGRSQTTPAALAVMDYIAANFDPNIAFKDIGVKAFPDMSYYGGGMMLTPNSNDEGGFLGMHMDAEVHAINTNWKREYSAVLCISEEHDSSFDMRLHDGETHARVPYKFNTLNVFKCTENSWHGFPEITKGYDRKTLGVMYWSIIPPLEAELARKKAKFNFDLVF
jgi:hypothetical protein